MYINGRWDEGTSGESIEGINPATEEVISRTPMGNTDDLNRAVSAARRAFDEGPWHRMSPADRSQALVRFAEVVRRRHEELNHLSVIESGAVKAPFSGGLGCAAWIEDAAHQSVDYLKPHNLHTLDSIGVTGLGQQFGGGAVVREPVGVVGAVTPFNAAGVVTSWKASAALAVGNTIVFKPSPFSPLQANFFAEAAEESELPPGVFNVVNDGPGVGAEMSRHPAVDAISFTGFHGCGTRDHGPGGWHGEATPSSNSGVSRRTSSSQTRCNETPSGLPGT